MSEENTGQRNISSKLSHIILVVAQNWVLSDEMSNTIAEVAQKHGHPQGSVVCICGCRYDRDFLLEKSALTLVYSVRTVREPDESGVKHTVDLEYPAAKKRKITVIYDDQLEALEKFFKKLPKKPGTQSE